MGACPFRLPMIVESLEARYSTFLERTLTCSNRVICTPQGIGHPTNLWPETLTLPIGFLKETFGACNSPKRRKQSCWVSYQVEAGYKRDQGIEETKFLCDKSLIRWSEGNIIEHIQHLRVWQKASWDQIKLHHSGCRIGCVKILLLQESLLLDQDHPQLLWQLCLQDSSVSARVNKM